MKTLPCVSCSAENFLDCSGLPSHPVRVCCPEGTCALRSLTTTSVVVLGRFDGGASPPFDSPRPGLVGVREVDRVAPPVTGFRNSDETHPKHPLICVHLEE